MIYVGICETERHKCLLHQGETSYQREDIYSLWSSDDPYCNRYVSSGIENYTGNLTFTWWPVITSKSQEPVIVFCFAANNKQIWIIVQW